MAAGIRKTAIQGILERTKGNKASRVVLKVLKTTRRPELCGNVREYVLEGSTVNTDALMSYDDLAKDYDRKIIDHLECYAKGNVHTNGLENFWSLLKRCLKGTYVCVEPFHLFRYCDEQAFRFNERKNEDGDKGRFIAAVSGYFGKGLTYKNLIGLEDADGNALPPQTAGRGKRRKAHVEHEIKCGKCGKLFAVVTGGKAGKWKVESRNLYVRVATGARNKRLAWAICFACNHDTPFDARLIGVSKHNER